MPKPQIWIATTNQNKLREFKEMLSDYDVKSLLDLPQKLEIDENGKTFCENAMIKAKALAKVINQPSIGDDCGICITALDGFPGIYSRRWALPTEAAGEVNQLLLNLLDDKKLTSKEQRSAQMVTCVAYYNPSNNDEEYFEGELQGTIANGPRGNRVFGYDQIFEVNGTNKTLSELASHKNEFSHRGMAIKKLISYLESVEE